jgi:hypothetical protein
LQHARATLQALVNPLGDDQAPSSLLQSPGDHLLEQAESSDERRNGEVHAHVTCDGCGAGPPVYGRVMKCTDCDDFDFCSRCYQERDRLGHPRDHIFQPRSPPRAIDQGPLSLMSGGRGPMAGILLRLLEAELLYTALRHSEDPADAQETQEDKEMRSAEVLSTLTRIKYAPPSDREDSREPACEECALCLDEYSVGEEVLKLPCRHLFHEGCLGPWFTKSLTCPMCKQEVSVTSSV